MRNLLRISVMLACICSPAFAAEPVMYFVSVTGADDAALDGKTTATAWRSLAFACDRVDVSEAVIQLGAGTFVADRTARPKSGVTIAGQRDVARQKSADKDSAKSPVTRIVAAKDWKLAEKITDMGPDDEYLIDLKRVKGVTIRDLVLSSDPEHRITGAIHVRDGENVVLEDLVVRDFRWNGLALEHSHHLTVQRCLIENASIDKLHHHGGLIRTRWIKNSELHHNQLMATQGHGYGYKGGGHEGVRLHHNTIRVVSEFAIESAHENEYGLEIAHNVLNRCVSVPKGGQGDDPNKRGFEYSVWIHDNLMTDSYGVEGPRSHLRLSRNYIRCEKTGGRIYTHHGGTNHGPVWIHHNVIENVDRAFVWMNEGLAENISVFNNTVTFADAGERAGAVLDAYTGERLNGWVVKNNVFIAPASQPRRLMPTERGVPQKITASHNLCIHITGAPAGNHLDTPPGFRLEGDKPWPFYVPATANSFVIGRGTDVGFPFKGQAPTLGAFNFGDVQPGAAKDVSK
ncbi:MAG: right-handed parallel beta-helix repeat-containing protein [Planctomycetaceae bacterium]